MTQFDRETLKKLMKLCRIECSEEEEADIVSSLARVLNFVEQLGEISIEGVPSCRYVLRGMQRSPLEQDVVRDVLARETFLSNAPDQVGGMIRTPPVLREP